MKFVIVSALALAMMLGAWISGSARAEDYFKVEIKGRFNAYGGLGQGFQPVIVSGGAEYQLDLPPRPGKEFGEKRLKEMNNEIVIIQGTLILQPGFNPRVAMTKITVVPAKAEK